MTLPPLPYPDLSPGEVVPRPTWRVCFLPEATPTPAEPAPFVTSLPEDWQSWLRSGGVPAGTPFLLDPELSYDVDLNAFFRSAEMLVSARNTQAGYARDLAQFLTFLWAAREQRSWRDVTAEDHVAYLTWRTRDLSGPQVSAATWNREVAAVNRFYAWQVDDGSLRSNPVPQVRRRRRSPFRSASGEPGRRPATYSHAAMRERVQWLPPASYRRWRDSGIRGYSAEGLPQPFRGRWAARNATFCDLMVRTGLRLTEQASLTVFDLPRGSASGYSRFWLPPAVAKGGSARWVYVPAAVLAEIDTYRQLDRADVVAGARAAGRYSGPGWWVVEDPARAVASGLRGRQLKVSALRPEDRRRLLVRGDAGLEPAALWLSEAGEPMAVSTWKTIFRDANARCAARGLDVRAHPHLLRHTFAVVTLEQLQRGHLGALTELTAEQRGHYTRIFGDPLDWVRRRLGHTSVLTTQIYLHALQELEMETRMGLVPDGWDDPPLHAEESEDPTVGQRRPGDLLQR